MMRPYKVHEIQKRPVRGHPGRRFVPTEAQRRDVGLLIVAGLSRAAIARAVGMSPITLNKHFAEELATGLAKHRLEIIGLLFKAGRAGNVAALKRLEALTRRAVGT